MRIQGAQWRRHGGHDILDQWVTLGDYTVTLDVGGGTLTGKVNVAKTMGWTIGVVPQTLR